MVLTRPNPGDPVVAEDFGQPVYDAIINLRSPVVGLKIASVTQPNISSSYTDITGMAVTFTAKANHLYRIDYSASLIGSAGGWALVQVYGGGIGNQVAFASLAFSSLATQATYGHTPMGVYFVGPGQPYSFAAGSVTMRLAVNASPFTSFGVSGTCVLAVTDVTGA